MLCGGARRANRTKPIVSVQDSVMTPTQFVQAPLRGEISVSRVFWLYGVVGSLVYGLLEFFIDPANAFLIRLYTVGAYAYSVYVIVGTYRCAVNCKTAGMARFVRISAIASLILLPVFMYFELSGALDGELSQFQQLNF